MGCANGIHQSQWQLSGLQRRVNAISTARPNLRIINVRCTPPSPLVLEGSRAIVDGSQCHRPQSFLSEPLHSCIFAYVSFSLEFEILAQCQIVFPCAAKSLRAISMF